MSRHVLRDDETYLVVVGYDDPLDTFFAQVYDKVAGRANPAGADVLLVQTGLTPRDVVDPIMCVASVRRFLADEHLRPDDPRLPRIGEVIFALGHDRENRCEPTEFQRFTARSLAGLELP